MPKLDLAMIEPVCRTGYPPPFDQDMAGRWQQRFGALAGFRLLGANMVTLEPGAWSSQRHWHRGEDELLVMLEGEAVLVEDEGATVLRPGDICTWAAGVANGHHLRNDSGAPCRFLAVSAGDEAAGGDYPDIDLIWNAAGYAHKDGTPY